MVLLGRAEVVVVDDRWLKATRWMTIGKQSWRIVSKAKYKQWKHVKNRVVQNRWRVRGVQEGGDQL